MSARATPRLCAAMARCLTSVKWADGSPTQDVGVAMQNMIDAYRSGRIRDPASPKARGFAHVLESAYRCRHTSRARPN